MNNNQKFSRLLKDCRLTVAGAARLLDVRPDTAYRWNINREGYNCPDSIIRDLEKLKKAMRDIFG